MDRSAHVTYRKRAGVFEITIRRGVTNQELQILQSKLSMHRLSVQGSYLVQIKGTRHVNLGLLANVDLRKLRELIDECIRQYGICGLQITESAAGTGALYKPHVHGARFKNNARRGKGPYAKRRKPIEAY